MRRPVLLCVLGLLLAVVGTGVLVAAGDPGTGEAGWFAYTPLDPGGDVTVVWVTRERVVGVAAALVGLLVAVGAAGYALGRRRVP